MKIYNWGLISSYEDTLDLLYNNNPSCDRLELKGILDMAMTVGGEHQRDLLLADAVEIILD